MTSANIRRFADYVRVRTKVKGPSLEIHTERSKAHKAFRCYSLSGLECNLIVLLSVALVDGLEVEGLREEVVYEGAEGGSVRPTGGEVLDLDTLRKSLRHIKGGWES